MAPKLWDTVRFEVDHRGELGQFILTGSAVPADTKEITHSGTGRFTWLTMRPMSLSESGDSTGDISLKVLFENTEEVDGTANLSLDHFRHVFVDDAQQIDAVALFTAPPQQLHP